MSGYPGWRDWKPTIEEVSGCIDFGSKPTKYHAVKVTTADGVAVQCRVLGLPEPVREYRFHPIRRWRFDWAFVEAKVALECDGGAFLPGGGRHTRGAGYRADCEKRAEAAILGWRIIAALPEQIESGQAILWVQRAIETFRACYPNICVREEIR